MPRVPSRVYPDPTSTAESRAPDRIHVAVIGGGTTGLSVARAVSAAGGDVVVFESNGIGCGSTRHSLGVLAAHYPGGPGAVMRRVGSGKATALWLAAAESMADVTTIIDDHEVSIATLVTKRHSADVLRDDASWLADRGFEAAYREDDRRLITRGSVTDPSGLVTALGEAVEKEGGVLCEGVAVTSLSRHTAGYQVLSTAGKTTADAVVVAAGAKRTRPGVHPPDPVMLPTDRYGARVKVGDTSVVMTDADVVRAGALTIRRLTSSELLIGGHVGIAPGLPADAGAARLASLLSRRFPGIGETHITEAWSAPTGLTADAVPHVWRTDGIWFAGGYNGDALVPAMAVGRELGELLGGARTQTIFAGVTPPARRRRRAGRIGAALERVFDR